MGTDPRFRQFAEIIGQIIWTGAAAMTAEQIQDIIDRETAHQDAGHEPAEREADDGAERRQAQTQARRAEIDASWRQFQTRRGQIMFAHFAPIAA